MLTVPYNRIWRNTTKDSQPAIFNVICLIGFLEWAFGEFLFGPCAIKWFPEKVSRAFPCGCWENTSEAKKGFRNLIAKGDRSVINRTSFKLQHSMGNSIFKLDSVLFSFSSYFDCLPKLFLNSFRALYARLQFHWVWLVNIHKITLKVFNFSAVLSSNCSKVFIGLHPTRPRTRRLCSLRLCSTCKWK